MIRDQKIRDKQVTKSPRDAYVTNCGCSLIWKVCKGTQNVEPTRKLFNQRPTKRSKTRLFQIPSSRLSYPHSSSPTPSHSREVRSNPSSMGEIWVSDADSTSR